MTSKFAAVFQFKLEVQNVRPRVWRRFQIASSDTFWGLHCAIQSLMGFDSKALSPFTFTMPKDI